MNTMSVRQRLVESVIMRMSEVRQLLKTWGHKLPQASYKKNVHYSQAVYIIHQSRLLFKNLVITFNVLCCTGSFATPLREDKW